jgi:ketosteroid isomerase-like protein
MRFLTHRQHLAHDGSCKGFVKSPYQQELEEIHVKRFHRKYHSTYCDRRYRARVDDPSALAQAPQNTTATSKPPAEIQSLIDAHINAFNTQDNKLLFSVFGDTAIIIDGIAPYRWLHPNAPAKWMVDVEQWRRNLGVTKEHLSYEMGFWNVEGSSAYAVILGTLTVTTKGQSSVHTGTLAYTFAERDGVWKIETQAWGRTS